MWHCICGTVGILRNIISYDGDTVVFKCYCDDCRKYYRVTWDKETDYLIEMNIKRSDTNED
jgi:hypothetical protein